MITRSESPNPKNPPLYLDLPIGEQAQAVLAKWRIANAFEVYPGTDTRDVAVRFQEHVMPFFSRTLSFEPAKR